MALTNDANTPEIDGALVAHPVEAATKIFAGSLVAINAAGNAVPAANTVGLKVVGRAEAQIDNSTGLAGALQVTLKRGVFKFTNSVGAPLTVADIQTTALVEDDGTVSKTTTNSIPAGKIIAIEANGVWVEVR